MEQRTPKVGEAVVYVDPVGVKHDGLVTNQFGPTCANVLWVSGDESRTDSYGRQVERMSSCSHASVNPAWGNYWRFPDEPGKDTERSL